MSTIDSILRPVTRIIDRITFGLNSDEPARLDAAWALVMLYAGAQALDVATTMFNITNVPGIIEAHGTMATVLSIGGVAGFIAVELAAVLSMVLLAVVLRREPQRALRTCLSIMLCAALTYGAVIWNALLAFHALSAAGGAQ